MLTKPKIPNVLRFSVAILVFPWLSALAQMSSTNYEIPVSVMDATGMQKSSTNYMIKDVVGQPSPVGNPKTGDSLKVLSGFIYTDGQIYIPGDVNSDCVVDAGDITYLVNYLYLKGPCPHPLKSGDVNCDCVVDSGDLVYLIGYVFQGGPAPLPGCVDPDP